MGRIRVRRERAIEAEGLKDTPCTQLSMQMEGKHIDESLQNGPIQQTTTIQIVSSKLLELEKTFN